MPPPTPTLKDRLVARRTSILDDVTHSFTALRSRVNAADRARLDEHADFIRGLEARFGGGGGPSMSAGCVRPLESDIPDYRQGEFSIGQQNGVTVPFQIENAVRALACDVTRVVALDFWMGYDPVFLSEFPGGSPFVSRNWHTAIHDTPQVTGADAPDLQTAYGFYARMFTLLVQRLAAIQDVDGSRLLDNTLVVWVSEMGYGSAHFDYDIPVIMAGMSSAFPLGQGRHVVHNRRSMGDLWAHVLRMLGGTDTTFGETGTLGSLTGQTGDYFNAWSGKESYINASTQLHRGALDL